MVLTRMELYGLGLATSVLTAACEAAGPDGRDARQSRVRIDLSQLGHALLQGGTISVIDAVTLTIAPENGAEQQLRRDATLTDAPVTFDVTVEAGTVRFATTLLSNNGTTLFEGEDTVEIRDDGFSVTLDPLAITPVLAISPDSTMVDANGVGTFTVQNLGTATLEWVVSVPDGGPVATFPAAGSIDAGGSQGLAVAGVPPGQVFPVSVQSPEGALEVKLQGPTPIFTVAVTPDGGVDEASEQGFGTAIFAVRNTGNVTDTYAITCAGGPGIACTELSPTSVTVPAGDSAAVTVDYTASADGDLVLTASSENATDQGNYAVDCCPAIRDGD